MTSLNLIRRLYDSVFWADERALRSLDEKDLEARRHLHHILAAERIWLMRLRGEDSSAQEIWPTLPDAEEASLAAENRAGFQRYLATLTEGDLDKRVDYANQTGRRFSTSTADILTHVAMHGAYHRGQLALSLRDGGGRPLNTDFITWVRELDEPGAG